MIDENTFKSLNITGENILKNDVFHDSSNYSLSDLDSESINNFIINSNLDDTTFIK